MDEYTVTIGGIEHTLLLSEEDAKRYGDDAVKAGSASTKKKAAPQNKAAE